MLESLRARVDMHTIPGRPAECWRWSASVLPNGRPRLGVKSAGRNTSVTAARVIAAHRDGLPLWGERVSDCKRWVAMHTCDNRGCVNPEHIVSGTYQDNTDDMKAKGRGQRGRMHSLAKLSPEKVRRIRRISAETGRSQESIGQEFGVSQTIIGQVLRGKIWSWVA